MTTENIRNREHELTAAVHAWWRAWGENDLDAIGYLATDDYLEFTGHTERHRVGRSTLLEVATRFFDKATIHRWEILDPVVRLYEKVGLVSYGWRSEVELEGQQWNRRGVATDLLVIEEDYWRYAAHHSTEIEATALN